MNLKAIGTLESAEYSKQDIKAREEAAIEAASYYLNKCDGYINAQSMKLLQKPSNYIKEKVSSSFECAAKASNEFQGILTN